MIATLERKADHFFEAPVIANGGMAIDISGHKLVRKVVEAGNELGINTIGTLPGTALATAISRKLQDGDKDEELRSAFAEFPDQEMANRVLKEHFIKDGRDGRPYKLIPMVGFKPRRSVEELIICATFAEVWLAKQGHKGKVAINFMEKVQTSLLYGILGALYGGADLIIVGAGLPDLIPGVIDNFVNYKPAEYPINVDGRKSTKFTMSLNPADFVAERLLNKGFERPRFAAVVTTNDLAELLVTGRLATEHYIDALILEHFSAGGHNALPRGAKKALNSRGEYEYSQRDIATYPEIAALDRPSLWAGSYTSRLKEVIDSGGTGVSFGTAAALSRESNLRPDLKELLIELAAEGLLDVLADVRCSPTEFPFNVAQIPGTMSDDIAYKGFEKECRFGYLRQAFRNPKDPKGGLVWRCFAESERTFYAKGGKIEDTCGRKCVCSGLLSTAGLDTGMPIVTLGQDIAALKEIIARYGRNYTIKNAIQYVARDFLPKAT